MDRRLIVEPLLPEADALRAVKAADRIASASFAPSRRREYLSWRAIVYRELGPVAIRYAACGAPYLADRPDVCIGVSHGAGRAAVALSDRPCAVDIERYDRDFARVAPRYLTLAERSLGEADPRFGAAAWCAKEVLCKLSGRQGLALMRDLHLTASGDGWSEGCVGDGEPIRLSVRDLGDAAVVWYL